MVECVNETKVSMKSATAGVASMPLAPVAITSYTVNFMSALYRTANLRP